MAHTSNAEPQVTTSLDEQLDRLLAFEPTTLPVISLYLNTTADQHGRDRFEQFLRKELTSRARTFASGSAERQCFEADAQKIQTWLADELKPSANGLALFACSAADLWETVQLNTSIGENRLYIYNQPHLYHLARLDDQYPRYAALITDANSARVFIFGLGATLETEQVKGKKVQRVKVGGWSQARYQRRVQNAQASHAKEVVDTLATIVEQDRIKYVVIAGDPQTTSVLTNEMSKDLAEKVVDTLRLNIKASDQQIFEATLESMRKVDAATDAEKVERLLNEYRRGGLACVGPQETLEALTNGQVDELLISAALEDEHPEPEPVDAIVAPEIPDPAGSTETDEPRPVLLPDLLVTKAKQTDAIVTFIERAELLQQVDGVAAFLRWRT